MAEEPKRISTLYFHPSMLKKKPGTVKEELVGEQLCSTCGEKFDSPVDLKQHMKLHLPEDPDWHDSTGDYTDDEYMEEEIKEELAEDEEESEKLTCFFCKKVYYSRLDLRRHIKARHGEQTAPFKCPICPRRFVYEGMLNSHIMSCHCKEGKTGDQLVSKLMQGIKSSENHMVLFTGEKPKPYKCAVCLKQFRKLYRVRDHTRTHEGIKPFQCPVCNVQFYSSEAMSRHMRGVHKVKPSSVITESKKATIGETKLKTESNEPTTTIIQVDDIAALQALSNSIQHNSELSFVNESDVITIDYNNQQYHITTPTTQYEQTYQGSQTPTLEYHQLEQYQEQVPQYQQYEQYHQPETQLSEVYVQAKVVPQHPPRRRRKRNEIVEPVDLTNTSFKCTVCNESFSNTTLLMRHVDSAHKVTVQVPIRCTICAKEFKEESYLKRHMMCHSEEKPYKCTICAKMFARRYRLEAHMKVHTGEKSQHCPICDKAFAIKDGLRRHFKKVHGKDGWQLEAGTDTISNINYPQ